MLKNIGEAEGLILNGGSYDRPPFAKLAIPPTDSEPPFGIGK